MLGAGQRLPEQGTVCLSVNNDDKAEVVPIAKALAELGFSLLGTRGTAVYLRAHGVECGVVFKVNEGRPNLADEIVNRRIHLVVNTPLGPRVVLRRQGGAARGDDGRHPVHHDDDRRGRGGRRGAGAEGARARRALAAGVLPGHRAGALLTFGAGRGFCGTAPCAGALPSAERQRPQRRRVPRTALARHRTVAARTLPVAPRRAEPVLASPRRCCVQLPVLVSAAHRRRRLAGVWCPAYALAGGRRRECAAAVAACASGDGLGAVVLPRPGLVGAGGLALARAARRSAAAADPSIVAVLEDAGVLADDAPRPGRSVALDGTPHRRCRRRRALGAAAARGVAPGLGPCGCPTPVRGDDLAAVGGGDGAGAGRPVAGGPPGRP